MNPRIHKVGSSFRGLAAYLLHDKGAESAERVAWVETHNMGTSNPETAWRVMAATAMKQSELKEAAGVSNTGRKSKGVVLHYSLSWAEHEAEGLTKEEMIRAAKSSMAAYGVDPDLFKPSAKNIPKRRQFADEHQAMIVCHSDEKHPHVHVVVNRVHPEHGAILPTGKDQEKLSRWALDYEKSRGEVLCTQRERNWNMRDRGIWVKGEDHEPRHVWEMRKQILGKAANDNPSPALQKLKAEQTARNAALGKEGGEQAKRHRQAWIALSEAYKARQVQINEKLLQDIKKARAASAREFGPRMKALQEMQAEQRAKFEANESDLRGRAGNVWASVKLIAQIRGEDPSNFKMKDLFSPFAGQGARLDLLRRSQAQEMRALEKEQEAKLHIEIEKSAQAKQEADQENAERYKASKNDLRLTQDIESAALKAKWKSRNDQQREAYCELAEKLKHAEKLKEDYKNALSSSANSISGPENEKGNDGQER